MCDRCVEWGGRTWHMWRRGYYETSIRLHREVWIAANGPIPEGYDVHHKNNDKTDNRLENLELLSKSEHSRLGFADKITSERRAKGMRNAARARRRNERERLRRRLHCIVCGGEYRSKSTRPAAYCSEACLTKLRSGRFQAEGRVCCYCGQPYQATRRAQKYCSRECNNLATAERSASRVEREIRCAQCAESFVSGRSNARFCSRPCALAFHSDNRFRGKVSDAVRRVRHSG